MSAIAYTKILKMDVESAINKITPLLKEIGFGVLTRIDFDQKIKEKLNKDMNKTVILGVCNPLLAHEAYKQNTDVALLIPCNLVITQKNSNECSLELMKPKQMINFLPNVKIDDLLAKADTDLTKLFQSL
jgi:uncharacterized protein (DUF302 family)